MVAELWARFSRRVEEPVVDMFVLFTVPTTAMGREKGEGFGSVYLTRFRKLLGSRYL
jgi:hypothetical protein